MGLMQQFDEPNVITTSTDKVFNWARKNSLWPLQFGLACCAIEMMSTGMAHNDLERFGSSPFMGSPRQADVMIVSGTVSTKMAERMTRLYEQMAEPKWVIAMGACAISGGPFLDGYSVLMGADRVIPVDVYVPGCPPRPEALIFGIMALQKKVERDMQVGRNRPKAALVDEDGTIREYLPEREYTGMSEGIAERFEGVASLKRTYTFERTGLPPGAMTDPGWVPPEVQKKLKEEERAKKAAAKEAAAKKKPAEGDGAEAGSQKSGGATTTAERPDGKSSEADGSGETES
ncbi:NADH-quinone oxidoreductase, B subunit [Rubrobacter radiotolerans]|uniref:NADH-quinone oxidoreductase subunit B n=1 Tax=Rubrobacter radiotolerans TaxID=42256 RepID=A0A023X310_RUBRA|nr:NADH-quinone oxidoreductase, B subunit [Rubrobacter radiotolerans]SMC05594.1 NADH-quinone oxidoreductase subunit B [Rubrobacter radiotolerans DSM 5868]